MSKTFNQVKLNVNFTAISPSSNMSNIASDDNISDTLAKIHHWYVKTNGFQPASPPLVSTSNDGIVTTLPSTTGGFLKNTGTAGGAWTTLGDSDIPDTVVRKTGNRNLSGLFEPTSNNGANLGSINYRFNNIYGTHLFGTDFNGFTIGKSVPSDAVFTDHIATATTTGAGVGKAVTSISDDGAGNITAATGSFLPSTTTYAGSDTVGGSASKAKSLNVYIYNYNAAPNQIIDTANFEVGALLNSSTHNDSFVIKFNDTNEAITSAAMSYLIIDNDRQDLIFKSTKNDGTQLFQKTVLTEDDISSFIPISGSTAITGDLVLSTNESSDIGSSTKAWNSVYAKNLCGSHIYTTSTLASGNITIHGTFLPNINNSYDLGHESLYWKNLYASTVNVGKATGIKFINILTTGGTTSGSLISDATRDVTWTLPSNGGTIALTSDIQTNTDEKVKTTAVTSTIDSTAYRPIFSYGAGTASAYISEALKIGHHVGTASGEGNVRLILGNNIAKGTAGNQSGWICMYGPGTGYVRLVAPNVSSDSYVITLPAATGTVALDGHTHSYIPLSGSSSITGSLIPSVTESYDLGSSDKIWNYTYTNDLVAYSSIRHCVPSSDGWTRGIKYSDYTDSLSLGRIGACGSGSTLSYYFIGDSYSDTSHLVRVDNDGAGKMTLVGTLPQLKFRQTTSGSAYNNNNAGIKCYTANANGMNMTIQSGGNIIIGSGEFPTNIYNRSVNDSNFSIQYGSSSYYKPTDTLENTWIGSDGNIYLFANATNIGTTENTDHYFWQFNMNGKTWLPKGKDLNWTNSNGYITSMAPGANTTNITLTLPSSSGTLINDTNIRGSRTHSSTNSYNEESISKVQLPKGCAYSSGTTLGWHLIATITREGSSNTNYNIGGTLLCQTGNNMSTSPGLLYINSRAGTTAGTVSSQYLRWIRPMFKLSATTSQVETDIKYCAITWNNKKCTDPTVGDLSSSTYNSTGDITTQIWVKLPAQYISHSCTLIDQIMPPESNGTTDYVRWHFPSNVVRNDSSWSNFYTSSNFGDPASPSSASSSTIVGKAYAAAGNNATNIYLARYVDEQVTGYPETPMLVTQLIDLTTLSWTKSGQGLYYSSEVTISTTISSTSYNCVKVYAVHIANFGNLKETDNVNVISNSNTNKIRVTASTNSFYSNGTTHANITVAVYGLFYK
jgi:hypothetical protein